VNASDPANPLAHGRLDWVVVGGESGPGARRFNEDWARALLIQCRGAGVPFFMKQTGTDHTALYERLQKDRKGGDPAEWPADLRVREYPNGGLK
jgi:protein gp37